MKVNFYFHNIKKSINFSSHPCYVIYLLFMSSLLTLVIVGFDETLKQANAQQLQLQQPNQMQWQTYMDPKTHIISCWLEGNRK